VPPVSWFFIKISFELKGRGNNTRIIDNRQMLGLVQTLVIAMTDFPTVMKQFLLSSRQHFLKYRQVKRWQEN